MEAVNYEAVACQFYDQLELIAIRKQVCTLEFVDEKGSLRTVETKIIDLFSRDNEEFILLENDLIIRLDKINRINSWFTDKG